MEELRISAKDLGALAMPNFCPRCFWIRRRLKRLPFQIFPGIFSSIDSFSKKVTNVHHACHTRVPDWFNARWKFECPVKTPSRTTFFVDDPNLGVRLTGVPDEVFRNQDGTYFIADYKTARYTENQDNLMPIYVVQLNAYAYIGNRTSLNPVTGLGLVYYEPPEDLEENDLTEVILPDGFNMPFRARLHPINVDPDGIIPPLLQRAREVFDLPSAPNRFDGCDDCSAIDQLIALATA